MAAVFLVMLYEYSPPFYITVIALCFVITVALVLGWFGFDVPVILRSSDDRDSVANIPEKRMVRVTNPFVLELGGGPASLPDGVHLRPRCLEDCVLSCYWGCSIQALQASLCSHQSGGNPLNTPQRFEEALQYKYVHAQSLHLDKEDSAERFTQIPVDMGVSHLGPMPRSCYPLVTLLTLAEQAVRDEYEIIASVTVIHVPDEKYKLPARMLFQYLLTTQGSMYELKPLFMSTVERNQSEPQCQHEGEEPDGELSNMAPPINEEDGEEARGARAVQDCVACQNAPVNRVLLPCRHTCLCDRCVGRVQHCPMCRAFVLESFALTQPLPQQEE